VTSAESTAGVDWFLVDGVPTPTFGRGIYNEQLQDFYVLDTSVPEFQPLKTQFTVEATQVGGEYLRDHLSSLRDGFTVTDTCGRVPTVNYNGPSFMPVGQVTEIRWNARDAGPTNEDGTGFNIGTFTQQVLVQDTLPPIVVPPPGKVVEASVGSAIDIGRPAVFDLADVRPTIVSDAPASYAPDSRTLVTWSATDASGNSTSANQWVTIKEPGTNTAPFANGSVDFEALKQLVEWQISEGSTGLVPVGTTGESPTLSHEEHETVIEEVVRAAAGRIPVIAGAGSNNTLESIRFMQHAERVGASAALVVTPYYNKPTQRGLIAHYTALHDCCELPIIIYNIPGRSVVDMTPETMGELAKLPRIIGVKDATGDLARVSLQRMTCGPDFIQISGEDPTAHGFNAQGGVGVISVTANVAPGMIADVQEATLQGDYARALEIQDRLMPLHRAIFTEPGLVGVKYAMSKLGLCSEEVRSPLTGLSEATKALVEDGMRHAGLMN